MFVHINICPDMRGPTISHVAMCLIQYIYSHIGYDSSLVELVPQMYKTGNMTYGASATPPLQQTVVE